MQPLIDRYVKAGDFQLIQHPVDFIGVNYYFPERVVPNAGAPFGFEVVPAPAHIPKTAMDWEIRAASLTETLLAVRQRYSKLPPIYVTENGAAFADKIEPEGGIDDRNRIDFLQEHIAALADAKRAGVDVRGYFVWSLLDNFEWAYGYARRFGLVYVDYPTQRRTPKASFYWYQQFIRTAQES